MIDWAAKWFEIRAEMGQSDMATMMYQDSSGNWHEHHFRHRETDGFGKIQTLLENEGVKIEAPIRPLKRPSTWKQPFLLIKGILIHPKLNYNPWKNFSTENFPHDPKKVSHWFLTPEENILLKKKAAEKNLNLGFYILSEIDKRIKQSLYQNTEDESHWLCPVDVRGAYPEVPRSQNCVSFVIAKIKGSSIQQSFEEYRGNLKKQTYWAFWELYQIGKWIGLSGMKKLAHRAQGKSFWMGSFSDLGIWNQESLKNSVAANRYWVIAPPGSSSYPVGVTTIEWCGNRSITLKIHPAICGSHVSREISDEILNGFKLTLV